MIPGLWCAPLNGISGWLPENKTQDFNLEKLIRNNKNQTTDTSKNNTTGLTIKPKKYTDILASEIPGVEAFFDFDEALAAAKQMHRPIMIDFTGHSCANCRKMEEQVWKNPDVLKRMKENRILKLCILLCTIYNNTYMIFI